MAIVRQKTTVFNKPVGVVRSNVGAQQIGESISRAASGIQRIAFQEATQVAQKKGADFAKALDSEQFRSIDPTGKTTGFTDMPLSPASFGSVAARAFQNVVDKRYETSINNELEIKAEEVALKYPFDSESYADVMADYIASMSEGSIEKYKALIEERGALYLARTKTGIDKNILARSRENASASIDEGLSFTGIQILKKASQGPEFNAEVDELILEGALNAKDGVDANLKKEGFDTLSARQLKLEGAKGSIDYLLSISVDRGERKEIQLAISTRGTQMGGLNKEKQALVKRIVSLSGSDIPISLSYSVTKSTPFDAVETEQEAQQQDRNIEFYRDFGDDINQFNFDPTGVQDSIKSGDTANINASINNISSALERKITSVEAMFNRQTDKSFYTEDKKNADILSLKEKALYAMTVQAGADGNLESLASAIITGNPEDIQRLTDTQKVFVTSLIKSGLFDRNNNELDDFINRTVNKGQTNITQRQGRIEIETNLNEQLSTYLEHVNAGGAIEGAEGILSFDDLNKLIDNAEVNEAISSPQAVSHRNNLRSQSSNSFIVTFSEGATSGDMADLQTYVDTSGNTFEGADGRPFSQKVIETGKKILENKQNASEINAAVSKISGITALKARDESNEAAIKAAIQDKKDLGNRFITNSLNPSDSKHQDFVDDYIEGTFAELLSNMGLQSSEQMFNDPRMFATDEGRRLLSLIGKSNTMPASLKAALESLSDGQFLGNNSQVLLSHFANFYEYESEGITMRSPMMDSLSDEAYSTLEYLYDAGRTGLLDASDPSSIQRILDKKQDFENDPLFKQKVETRLDSTLDEFVMSIENINNMPLSAVNGLKALALNLVSLEGENFKTKKIKDLLERQLAKKYPDGGGIVFGVGGSRNTIAPIVKAAGAGNEDLFKAHIMNEVFRANPNRTGTFILGIGVPPGISIYGDTFTSVREPTDLSPEGLKEFARQNVQFLEGTGNIFLKPIGVPSSGLIQYAVFRKVPLEEGGSVQVRKTVEGRGQKGERESYTIPLIISNKDEAFVNAVSERKSKEIQQEISTAKQIFSSPRSVSVSTFSGGGFLALPEGSLVDPTMVLN